MSAVAAETPDTFWSRRLRGVVPALRWLRECDARTARADLIAGVTLAAYLLPAALGDASLAQLPPEAGLDACLFGGLVSCATSAIVLVVFTSQPKSWFGSIAGWLFTTRRPSDV